MQIKHFLALMLLTSAVWFSGFAAAESTSASAPRDSAELLKELDALEAEINKFKSMLKQTESERSELESTLERNEEDINVILKRMDKIQKDLRKGQNKLSHLSEEQQSLEQKKK